MTKQRQIRIDRRLEHAIEETARAAGLSFSDWLKKLAIDRIGFDIIYDTPEKIEHKPAGEIQTREG